MKKAIIIPVYLKLNDPEELTSLEGVRLAKRAIQSLKVLEDQDFTLILPVCFDLTGSDETRHWLEMDKLFKLEMESLWTGRTVVFSSFALEALREWVARKNFGSISSLIDLKGYSKMRNTGLILAQALSIDVVTFIDNDEVVEDPDYLAVACRSLNKPWNGRIVNGKGGFYLNPDGSILLPRQRLWWRGLWNKTFWMNRVWEKILSSSHPLVPSPVLLGGNLVLHQSVFQSIPFDPFIPRGEDTDYLINASQQGFFLLFDKQLRIKHLHPERTQSFFQEELRGDIERFVYEREKTRGGLSVDLDPYPGNFLKWSLTPKAILTSLLLSFDYVSKGEWKKARASLSNIPLVLQRRKEGWSRYLSFRADWEKMMVTIRQEGMKEIIDRCWA
jgi:glycosyltransferase involved in cell wall biosynthesis